MDMGKIWNHPSAKPLLAGVVIGMLLHMPFDLIIHQSSPVVYFPRGVNTRSVPSRLPPATQEEDQVPITTLNLQNLIATVTESPVDDQWLASYAKALDVLGSTYAQASPQQKPSVGEQVKSLIATAHRRGDQKIAGSQKVSEKEQRLKTEISTR